MLRYITLLVTLSFIPFGIPIASAETVELITYYPAQVNLGEANLNNATIGNINETPGPGELFVESRVRIGEPGDASDTTDSRLSVFSDVTNTSNGLINVGVTNPISGSGDAGELRFLTVTKRNALDTARLDWTLSLLSGDTPGLFFFRTLRPDSGPPEFQNPLTLGWDNKVGINTTEPEAALHVTGSDNSWGNILLEKGRGLKIKYSGTNEDLNQYVLSRAQSSDNILLNQGAPTGSLHLAVNNSNANSSIQFRTGIDSDPDDAIDETIRMRIFNDGRVRVYGDLEVDGNILQVKNVTLGNGDVTGDGLLRMSDILSYLSLLGNNESRFGDPEQHIRADMNGDGIITLYDVSETVRRIIAGGGLSTPAGPLTQGPSGYRNILKNTVSVDQSQNAGIGIVHPMVKANDDFTPVVPPDGALSGNLNVHDIYLRSQGKWVSETSSGGHDPAFETDWFYVEKNKEYVFDHGLSRLPRDIQVYFSPNTSGNPAYIAPRLNREWINGYNIEITPTQFKLRTATWAVCVWRDGGPGYPGKNPTSGYYKVIAWE